MSDWPTHDPGPSLEWEKVAIQVLGASAAAITFSGIATAYRVFMLNLHAVKDGSGSNIAIRCNGDTTNVYARQRMFGNGTSVSSQRNTGSTRLFFNGATAVIANQTLSGIATLTKPVTTTKLRMTASSSYVGTAGDIMSEIKSGEWNNVTNLLSEISVFPDSGNLAAGSRAVLSAARNTL